jgi:alpha-beta hydrolase superfamily lysophospholipase
MNSLRHAASAARILSFVLIAVGAAVAFVVFKIAHAVVTPSRRVPDTEVLGIDVGAQTIELSRTADTELPGRYGLFTKGTHSYLKLGTVLDTTASSVRRKLLTKIGPDAEIETEAAFSGWYYTAPGELHLPYESVIIGSVVGPCPAWLFPADGPTWVIQVHGRGATRAECLRAVPLFHDRDMPVLVVSYRNDGEATRSRGGAYGLGSTEWQDIDAAITYALHNGAKDVVLMGWSMGGAIVLQTLTSSPSRDFIKGVILESPVVDWRSVLDFHAKLAGMREPLPSLAIGALSSDFTARLSGAEGAIPFDRLDMVSRANEITVPILLLHSDDDGYVPSDASHALAAARPDIVTMPVFKTARHTKLWNHDEQAWTQSIRGWLQDTGIG